MAAVTITHRPGIGYGAEPTIRAVPDVGRARPTGVHRPARRASAATYRRRRAAAVVLALAVVVAAGKAGSALGGSPLAAPERRPATETIVRPGDSLQAVAGRLAPGADGAAVADALADARQGAPLLPGETVRWPG